MHPSRRPVVRYMTILLSSGLAALALHARAEAPKPLELPAEILTTIPAITQGERIYVADLSVSHLADGRVRVFDARGGKLLGTLSAGFFGNFGLSPKVDEIYVATTYLSRGDKGERADVLEVYDTRTLLQKYEVVLPPRRAQTLAYRGLVRTTSSGRYVLVQNATPATSITVVDLQQRKVVAEIATPGCWGILPASDHPQRFSMLCGDGKLATVTLDDAGQAAERQASEVLFNADEDAWFHHAENVGDRYWFVSFKGQVHELDLGGPAAKVVRPAWSIASQAGWRPGGYQAFAVDPQGRTLVAAMHDKGVEGSHKRPAKQLWVFDIASGKRVATAPGRGATSLNFSRSGQRLHALDGETGQLVVWTPDAKGALKLLVTIKRAGEAPIEVESHD